MSQIKTIVHIQYQDGKYWDISPMISNVDIMYGRNQPFMYQELTINKLYFSSRDAYWNANADQNTPRDNQNIVLLPSDNIVDGQTKVDIQAYGQAYTLILERHESSQDTISLICYNSAYYMQNAGTLKKSTTIHLEQGLPFLYGIGPMHELGDKYSLSFSKVNNFYTFTFTDPIDQDYTVSLRTTIQDFTATYVKDDETRNKIYHVGDVVFYSNKLYICTQITGTASEVPQTPSQSSQFWTDTGDVTPLYIECTGSELFKFFSFIVANYEEYVVDAGYSYNYTVVGSTVNKYYTLQQIEQIKSAPVIPSNDVFKLRVNNNYSCWDVLKQAGAQSNRWPFFYDFAYFVDYKSTNTERDSILDMDVDYGIDEEDGKSKTRFTKNGEDYDYIDLYTIVKNADQGSEYVQTSQKIYTETYNTEVSISDSINTSEGYALYFPYPESDPTDPSTINNLIRNQIVRKIALNRVVQNYKPSDAIQIQFSEVKDAQGMQPIGTYTDVQDLPTTGVTDGDYAIVIDDVIFHTYYQYAGGTWTQVSQGSLVQGEYVQKFKPYTSVGQIEDVQNGLTLTNVPLACVEITWPNCITQATFGNPEFMDAQKQWKSLSLESQISTIQGTEGSLISDRYASKIVIGNQTMSDLQDDRQGFTGLIMEKNYDNDLYRLVGYNEGVVQASFNSEGEIMSGNEQVIINQNGITIGPGGGTIDPSILPDVTSGIPVWDPTETYFVDDIVVWKGVIYVCIQDNDDTEPGTSGAQLVWSSSGRLTFWSSMETYHQGDYVSYKGKIYRCLQTADGTHAPGESGSEQYWEDSTYQLNLVDTTNLSGDIDATINEIIGGSIKVWQPNTAYVVGDVVYYEEDKLSYTCTTQHISSTSFNSSYWTQVQPSVSREGRTVIDSQGLTTYNSFGNPVCRVGTDGNIYGVRIKATDIEAGTLQSGVVYAGSINAQQIDTGLITASQINTTGLTVGYADSQGSTDNTKKVGMTSSSRGYVEIDQSGLRTYSSSSSHSSSTLQCEVNTSGYITQGGGSVALSKNGILIAPSSSESHSFLRYGTQWSDSTGWAIWSTTGSPLVEPQEKLSISHFGTNTTSLEISDRKGIQMMTGGGQASPYNGFYYNLGHQISIDSDNEIGYIKFHRGNYNDTGSSSSDVIYPFVINFGYNSSTSQTQTNITFRYKYQVACMYASCTTIRYTSSGSGNDYVTDYNTTTGTKVGKTGMCCKHDSGAGFYWIAIGI